MEALPDPSPVAAVVLDIGDGFGAVVIDTPPSLEGPKIEIQRWAPSGVASTRPSGPASFQRAPSSWPCSVRWPEGRYDLRVRGGLSECPVVSIDVTGASVTSFPWP